MFLHSAIIIVYYVSVAILDSKNTNQQNKVPEITELAFVKFPIIEHKKMIKPAYPALSILII